MSKAHTTEAGMYEVRYYLRYWRSSEAMTQAQAEQELAWLRGQGVRHARVRPVP